MEKSDMPKKNMWLNGFNYKFYKDPLKLALQHKQNDVEAKENPAIVVNLKLFERKHKQTNKQTDRRISETFASTDVSKTQTHP